MVAATVALASSVIAAAIVKYPLAPSATLALLAAAVVITELIEVSGDPDSPDTVEANSFSFSSGIHLAAALMVGPWRAALVAAFGVLAVDRLRGSSWRKVLFNASVFALSAFAGGYVFVLLGGHPGVLSLPGDFGGICAAAVTYAVLNSALVSTIVALASSANPWPLLCRSLESTFSVKAAETGFGLAFAFFAVSNPWLIVALAPLVIAQYQARARLRLLRSETSFALETFANVVDERDPYTFHHSDRVAEYASGLGEALGLPRLEVSRLRLAGRLHDLGKISVDASVLRKQGRLDDAEWVSMRRHPRLSARLLRRFRFAAEEARAVEYHHERYDGMGYYGLEPGAIPLASHFLIVADSYDAMTSDRPYRRGLPAEEALAEIESNLGTQFHPTVGRAFVALQRGIDPTTVLSADELAELQRPSLTRRTWSISIVPLLRKRPELLVFGGIVACLMGAGFAKALPAALGGAIALVGLAARGYTNLRTRRLVSSLRLGLVVDAAGREPIFHGVVGRLATSSTLRWAALVGWHQDELAGSVELEWRGDSHGPSETALTSWLIRDAEARSDLLHAAGHELGGDGAFLALSLRRAGAPAAYLVLGLGRPAPRHVELALEQTRDQLVERLTSPPPQEVPVERRLAAVS
jgi:putative nucleotidyltransferase with HDIG domain